MAHSKDHYSYRIYADPQVAGSFDADRFGGAIGEFLRESQENVVFRILSDVHDWKVIDVGAGTGRVTLPFLKAGAEVTACDASEEMLKILQSKTDNPSLRVQTVDAHHLPFPDQSFRCAICFRMLLHVVDWKKALAELCRVSNDWLVIDFPARHGFMLFAPLWHRIQSLFLSNVQTYRTIPLNEMNRELSDAGFQIVHMDPGFFLPIAVHRLVRNRSFSKVSERFFAAMGLTRMAGSPITLFARRMK